jgi:hypothetical protein
LGQSFYREFLLGTSLWRFALEAPGLWAELEREREVLGRPSEASPAGNTPFTADELETLRRELEALKDYVRTTTELEDGRQRAEVLARLDYLVAKAADGTPRIDWWNQVVGALFNLVITAAVQPHAFQSMIVMLAHGVATLFGGSPPPMLPPPA